MKYLKALNDRSASMIRKRIPLVARRSIALLLSAGAAAVLALFLGSSLGQTQTPAITVESLSIEGSPDGDVYVTGEEIEFQVEFSVRPDSVSTSDPIKLKLEIGENTRNVRGGFDGATAYFYYTVKSTDLDTDGISVNANALDGTLVVDGTSIDASTITHAAFDAGIGHRVRHPQPTVDSISFDGTPTGDVYETGDTISVEIEFSADVNLPSSNPMTLALQVGDNERTMTASVSGDTATLEYEVQATDYDTDGVSVDADSLEGTIKVGAVSFDASNISHSALSGGDDHEVNRAPPTIESIEFTSTPADTAYEAGEEITVDVEFSENVSADTSNPITLKLEVGSNERTMTGSFSGDTATMTYTVQNSDYDTDGVSVVADSLGGHIVVDSITLAASLISNDALDGGSDHQVNRGPPEIDGIEFVTTPSGDSYADGDRISIEFEFDEAVSGDSSDPVTLELQVGDNVRTLTGTFEGRFIYFDYTVQGSEYDTDGVSVVANSLDGTIIAASITFDASDISHAALNGGDAQRVNRAPPTIESIAFSSTPDDDVYVTDESISVVIDFGETVDGDTSDPLTLQLQVGGRVRTMSGTFDGEEAYLRYKVQAEDYDADGVTVIANSLSGTVVADSVSFDASNYSHDALDGGSDHRVNPIPITVESMEFRETPSDGFYDTGEEINLEVKFSVDPDIDPDDQIYLDLQIGDSVKRLWGGFESEYAYFWYVVEKDDYDGDGVSVNANALSGTFIVNGNRVDASMVAHDELLGGSERKVNRPDPVAVESVTISSTPSDDVYETDDEIEVVVVFDQAVTEGDDDVTLKLTVGSKERTMDATFDGTSVFFRYTVQSTDYDTDGIEIVANSMEGTIEYESGNHSQDATSLSFDAVAGGTDHRVNKLVFESLEIVSDPGDDDMYGVGDIIKVRATFNVHVSSILWDRNAETRLLLDVGDNQRTVQIKSGGGGILDFEYTVVEADVDNDGVSVPESPFTGSVAAFGTNVISVAGVTFAGIESDELVNAQPDIDSVEITSTPVDSYGYGAGDTITVTVTFNAGVQVGGSSGDALPTIDLQLGNETVQATANVSHGDQTTEMEFEYTVQADDFAHQGISVVAYSLDAHDSPLTFAANATEVRLLHYGTDIDATQVVDPRIQIVEVRFGTEPASGSFYGIDDTIEVEVVFNRAVQLVDEASTITLSGQDHPSEGSATSRTFELASGKGTDTLVFSSTVEVGDDSYKGISIDGLEDEDDWDNLLIGVNGGPMTASFSGLAQDFAQQAYGGQMATSVTVTSTPSDSAGYVNNEKFTFEVRFGADQPLIIEVDPEIDLQVGEDVVVATLVDGHAYAGPKKLRYEFEFASHHGDEDGIEILDTWFIVDGSYSRGYFLPGDPNDSSTYGQVIWKFVNPSPGVLSGHKVQSQRQAPGGNGLNWNPAD